MGGCSEHIGGILRFLQIIKACTANIYTLNIACIYANRILICETSFEFLAVKVYTLKIFVPALGQRRYRAEEVYDTRASI